MPIFRTSCLPLSGSLDFLLTFPSQDNEKATTRVPNAQATLVFLHHIGLVVKRLRVAVGTSYLQKIQQSIEHPVGETSMQENLPPQIPIHEQGLGCVSEVD